MTPKSNTTLSAQTWQDFRNKFNRKVLGNNRVPWMKSRELVILEEILANLKPAYCLEWGSGFSTFHFPQLLPDLKKWYSLEHHKGWFDTVKSGLTNPKVEVLLAEPDDRDYFSFKGKYGPKLEGLYEDFHTYIELPKSFGLKFDFIFIDGRARKECLKAAYDLISDHGVVVVHDANRDAYFEDLPPFSSTFRLTDHRHHRKEGGIWIGRKAGKVEDLVDVETHRQVWQRLKLMATVFFLR